MEKWKMKVKATLLFILIISILTGCSSQDKYTYNLDSGDAVTVRTIGDYKVKNSSGYFEIYLNDRKIGTGCFETNKQFDSYIDLLTKQDNSDIPRKYITTGNTNGGNPYIHYVYDDKSFNGKPKSFYIIWLNGTRSGILIESETEQSGKEAMDHLFFTVSSDNKGYSKDNKIKQFKEEIFKITTIQNTK